jgi:uracil phosphoribosyltransferase
MEPEEVPPLEEFAAFFMPLAKLTEIGIRNNKEPKEVVEYFVRVVEEFMKKMEKLGMEGELAELKEKVRD